MARIDKFIQAVIQSGSDKLLMQSGQQAVIVKGDGRKPVSARPATVAQIQEMLKEIIPAGQARTPWAPIESGSATVTSPGCSRM